MEIENELLVRLKTTKIKKKKSFTSFISFIRRLLASYLRIKNKSEHKFIWNRGFHQLLKLPNE